MLPMLFGGNLTLWACGAIVLALGVAVGVQQCTIDGLRAELADATADAAAAETGLTTCRGTVAALEQANRGLADAARRQDAAVQAWLQAADQAKAASAAALAQAEREAMRHRQVATDLAEIVRRRQDYVRPGECEAAAALAIVRQRWQR